MTMSATAVDASADASALRTARWVTVLFVLEVLLQRLAVPGMQVALLLPVLIAWATLAVRARVMELDGRRTLAWGAMVVVSGAALTLQTALLPSPLISSDSWMLFMVVWLPTVVRFVDRRITTYLLAVRRIVVVLTALAVGCVAMLSSQLVGIQYQDWPARLLPSSLILSGFNTTYPTEYGGTLYRANAWVGLEPSIVSFLLGVGLLAAVLTRRPWWQQLILALGLFSTYAGSGFTILVVGLLVMLAFPARRLLAWYAPPAVLFVGLASVVPLLQPLFERVQTEFFDPNSSASLRAVQGYVSLWPRWSGNPLGIIIGRGAGAAQRDLNDLSVGEALVPTPARILFDYGLVAGVVIIAVLVYYYLDGFSAALSFTMFFSLWVFQPGGSQPVFALPVMVLVTFFAPKAGPWIETAPDLTSRRRTSTPERSFMIRWPAEPPPARSGGRSVGASGSPRD